MVTTVIIFNIYWSQRKIHPRPPVDFRHFALLQLFNSLDRAQTPTWRQSTLSRLGVNHEHINLVKYVCDWCALLMAQLFRLPMRFFPPFRFHTHCHLNGHVSFSLCLSKQSDSKPFSSHIILHIVFAKSTIHSANWMQLWMSTVPMHGPNSNSL